MVWDQLNVHRQNLAFNFTPYVKINLKLITELNIILKSIKLLGKKHGSKFSEPGLGENLSGMILKHYL